MRACYSFLVVFSVIVISMGTAYSQCTPGDEITCPDIENNGQVCPDSLPEAIAGRPYSQAFTILAPPEYPLNQNDTLPLHHITLIDVQNLPAGFTWVSNETANEFMVGTYYCVLLEGSPAIAGNYPLKIVVNVYAPPVIPGGQPILLKQVTDSTSLFLQVNWDPNALNEPPDDAFSLVPFQPNPFSHQTRIGIIAAIPGTFTLEVFDLVGQLQHREVRDVLPGEQYFSFDGSMLKNGIYIARVSSDRFFVSRRLVKTD